jgi:transposase
LNAFFDEVGEKGTETIEAVSMDLGPAFAKSVRIRAPGATICFDAFHLVKLVTEALGEVRRQVWQSARKLRDKTIAKKYKGARWALLKNPGDLNADQTGTLREIKRFEVDTGVLVRGAVVWVNGESGPTVFLGAIDGMCVGLVASKLADDTRFDCGPDCCGA